MEKERYASVRPTPELLAVFEIINRIEVAQDTDRQAVFERAMQYVANGSGEVLKTAARQKVEDVDVGEIPTSLKVRVDTVLFEKIVKMFREAFQIERIKTPFLMRVTLMAYLQHIKSESTETIIEEIEPLVQFGIDPLVFKQEYERSEEPSKERLYKVSRKYLEEVDIELNKYIREQVNEQIQDISDYYNISKYLPKRGTTFAKTNIIFVSKVLAGLILLHCDMNCYDLEEVIRNLETAVSERRDLDGSKFY